MESSERDTTKNTHQTADGANGGLAFDDNLGQCFPAAQRRIGGRPPCPKAGPELHGSASAPREELEGPLQIVPACSQLGKFTAPFGNS